MITTTSTSVPRPASGDSPLPPPPTPPQPAAVWRAMAWKECRELALMAGLVMLVVGAVLGVELMLESRAVSNDFRSYSSASYQTAGDLFVTGVMALLAALAALVMGFMQFIVESRPDRFGFVVHRPVSRAWLFVCKVAVGLGLYLVALALPLVIAMWWASNPDHLLLPFSWRMGLPAVADILSGVPFYFAGMLVARRSEARWLGSRLLPAAAPVISAAANFAAPGLGLAVLASLIGTAVMAPAAWGAYTAGGQYRCLGRVSRATLGLTILVTLLMGGGIALSLLEEVFPPAPTSGDNWYQFLEFNKEGVPVIVRQQIPGNEWILTDLQGVIQPKPAGEHPTVQDATIPMSELFSINDPDYDGFRRGAGYFSSVFMAPGTEWYVATPRSGGGYLVGFDLMSRERIGAIGANGLEPGAAVPRARLAQPLNTVNFSRSGTDTTNLLSAGRTLYRLTPKLSLEPLYEAPNVIQRLGYIGEGQETNPDHRPTEFYPVVQTDRQVIVLSAEAKPQVLIRQALADVGKWKISLGRSPRTGQFLMWITSQSDLDPAGKPRVLYFTPEGKLDHEMELPDIGAQWTPSHGTIVDYVMPALAPAALVDVGTLVDGARLSRSAYYSQPGAAERERGYRQAGMLLSTAMGVLSAAGIFALTRWRQLPRKSTWLWTTLALLLGPVSFLLLLCTRGLPLIGPCPACGKLRPVQTPLCPHCRAPFASPQPTGTEIFTPSPDRQR